MYKHVIRPPKLKILATPLCVYARVANNLKVASESIVK